MPSITYTVTVEIDEETVARLKKVSNDYEFDFDWDDAPTSSDLEEWLTEYLSDAGSYAEVYNEDTDESDEGDQVKLTVIRSERGLEQTPTGLEGLSDLELASQLLHETAYSVSGKKLRKELDRRKNDTSPRRLAESPF